MSIVSFQKKFVHGLRWNSVESILYYSILAAHQIGLRTISSSTLYGAMGTLLALVYLTIVFFNWGLDFSIGPFFSIYISSKRLFRRYLLRQLIAQGFIYSLIATGMIIILAAGYLPIKGMPQISWFLALIISLLIVTEGVKKSLRIILQFAFLSHMTAGIELFYIISYVATIWISYVLFGSISLLNIFLPMLIISSVSTLFLVMALYKLYTIVPAGESGKTCSWKQIGYNRMSNYGYQVTRELFTSNFLIPFFAMKFGLGLAALLELVTAFNQFITIIIKKVFGITGQTLLSHAKNMKLAYKRVAFEMASRNLYRVLMVVMALILIGYKPLCDLKLTQSCTDSSLIGLLFFLLLFSENFILLYEKWFIIEEKTPYLILFNGSLLALFWAITKVAYTNSPYILLSTLIVLRFIAYFSLVGISFYKWQLKIPCPKKCCLAYVILLVLGCFFLFG